MRISLISLSVLMASTVLSCNSGDQDKSQAASSDSAAVRLVTLDPGHFHAALVQKSMYPDVDSVVHVYAPDGPDVQLHLDKIEAYNTRPDAPTRWKEVVYKGSDFLEKMVAEKAGNVVIMAGNNQKKTEYIFKSVEAGFNVLADKPMVIDSTNFELLKQAFQKAKENNVLLYDIMTERYEITTILQRELSMNSTVFGELEKGSTDKPAVTKESVHNFYKFVSGKALTRPPWFMDVSQEGEGIVDVTTHLVDLVQWECFPEKIIDYTKDIKLQTARRWTTDISLSQFKALTSLNAFPEYLNKYKSNDSVLKVYCNGEMNYVINGVHAKVSVIWNYKAPEGAGDTHYSIMRGSRSNLVIRQGAEQKYKPALYIEPVKNDRAFDADLAEQFKKIQSAYPGVELLKNARGWEVIVPEKYRDGHEAHFARVTEKYLQFLKDKKMPDWEVPNMIAKYYTTTAALKLAQQSSK